MTKYQFCLYFLIIFFISVVCYADLDQDIGGLLEREEYQKEGGKPEELLIEPDLGGRGEKTKKPPLDQSKDKPKVQEPTIPDTEDKSLKPKEPEKEEQTSIENQTQLPPPAKSTQTSEKRDPKIPIHWQANSLSGDRQGKFINLITNVEVKQGDVTINSDKATIFFDDENNVIRVVAENNVKLIRTASFPQDRVTAKGEEAVFLNKEQRVILKRNATLVRGNCVVRGKEISYNLNSGWVTVDKVEGVMQPGEEHSGQNNKSSNTKK